MTPRAKARAWMTLQQSTDPCVSIAALVSKAADVLDLEEGGQIPMWLIDVAGEVTSGVLPRPATVSLQGEDWAHD